MSRIGKKPIQIPNGVKCVINGSHIKVDGPKGSLERDIRPEIEIVEDGNTLLIKSKDDSKKTNAFRGMTRSLIDNMIVGSEQGFQKKLIVEGVGYRVKVAGKLVTLNVGYSNPVDFDLPESVSATVENNVLVLDSINKELLGLTAARIRAIRKPEPYKGKGIRYSDEHIVRKVGKSAGKK